MYRSPNKQNIQAITHESKQLTTQSDIRPNDEGKNWKTPLIQFMTSPI